MSEVDPVTEFCLICGCSPEEASQFLEIAAYDMDMAMSLYMDQQNGEPAGRYDVMDEESDVEEEDPIPTVSHESLRRVYTDDGKY